MLTLSNGPLGGVAGPISADGSCTGIPTCSSGPSFFLLTDRFAFFMVSFGGSPEKRAERTTGDDEVELPAFVS